MKKSSLTLISMLLLMSLNAQTTLTTAVDFTITDVHGNTHTLFDYLADGKHVVIDFFFTTCGPCQASVPTINDAYTQFGCNTAEVVFLSIDTGDDDAEVLAFENDFSSLLPAVSGLQGGGDAVVNQYGVGAFPTIVLIAPNQQIIEQDVWPVSGLESALINAGLTTASCDSSATTEIAETTFEKETFTNQIFDLLGKEWKCSFNDLPKGLYIINGKKVLKTE